jgi:mannose-1-phosphate guanylyltransferase
LKNKYHLLLYRSLLTITSVILSGGSGVRLWPLSRKQNPKQYLPLVGNNTMLQETILRLNGLDNLVDGSKETCNWYLSDY